jgi:hypothetical protein
MPRSKSPYETSVNFEQYRPLSDKSNCDFQWRQITTISYGRLSEILNRRNPAVEADAVGNLVSWRATEASHLGACLTFDI